MPFARGGLLAPLRQESAERLAVHLTGGVEAFLALVLLKRLLRLLTHDAVGWTGIEAAAVQGLLQHAGLRPGEMDRTGLGTLRVRRRIRRVWTGVLILAFVLILARVLVGFLIGILLLGHGWDCQGCGRE